MEKDKCFQPTIMQTKGIYICPIEEKYIKRTAASEVPTHNIIYLKQSKTLLDSTETVDFVCEEGTPVRASLDGVVIATEASITENVFGKDLPVEEIRDNDIIIKHPNGEYSIYQHLKHEGVAVATDQQVKAGDVIGYSGNTGMSSEPHLHFMVCIHGKMGLDITYVKSLKINWK